MQELDTLIEQSNLKTSRSECIRDLVRELIDENRCVQPDAAVVATLTLVFDHHAHDLQERLHEIQHSFCDTMISTTHIHLDEHTCLEVIILKGRAQEVQTIGLKILSTKGVLTGKLFLTNTDDVLGGMRS